MQKYTQTEYFSYIFSICALVATGWIFGHDNERLIKYWYATIMTLLLIMRVPDFKEKKYHHFLSELCYYVNLLAIYFLVMNYDIKHIYPYLHGPLLMYAIFSADAFIPQDLSRTTSFALHSFGTIVTRHLYWNSNERMTLDDLTKDSYMYYLQICFGIYLLWFVPYSFYVFWYKGKSITMIKYTLKLKENDNVTAYTKISYLLKHMLMTIMSINVGILLMYWRELDNIMCGLQLCSGIIQGSYYNATGKKIKFVDLIKKIKDKYQIKKIQIDEKQKKTN